MAGVSEKPDAGTLAGAAVSKRIAAIARGLPAREKRRRRARLALFLMALLGIFLARPVSHHARAAGLLMAFSDPKSKPDVTEELITIDVPSSPAGAARTVKARL